MIPNHILIIGPPSSGKSRIANHIVSHYGGSPSEEAIRKCTVSTKYYTMELKVLVDEFEHDKLATWMAEFSSGECDELREVIDGVLLCVDSKEHPASLIGTFIDTCSQMRQIVRHDAFVCVVDTQESVETEEVAISNGFEYVSTQQSGTNEFGEKTGQDRVVEILEAHEWMALDKKDDQYEQRKEAKIGDMLEGLLESTENTEEVMNEKDTSDPKDVSSISDFEAILRKVQQAKENAGEMDTEQREIYARQVISEIIDFI